MRHCTHDVSYAMVPCASCDEIERTIRAKELQEMADLRAENERLRGLVDQVADILEEWVKHMSEQDKKIYDLKASIVFALGK